MQCPVCRADNDLVETCRRCKADLGLLLQVERQRAVAVAEAGAAFAAGDRSAALRAAARAHQLRPGADTARLLAMGHLRAGRFAMALRWHTTAVAVAESG